MAKEAGVPIIPVRKHYVFFSGHRYLYVYVDFGLLKHGAKAKKSIESDRINHCLMVRTINSDEIYPTINVHMYLDTISCDKL